MVKLGETGGGRRERLFDRLSIRIALGVTSLVVAVLATGSYWLSRLHFDQTIEARRRAGALQNRILAAAIRHQMKEKDRTLIETILRELGAEPEVHNAMILDHRGVVKFSSRSGQVGQTISRESPTCLTCHAAEEKDREQWVRLEMDQTDVVRSVLPFENRQDCHACHDPQQPINGILILDVSLDEVHSQLRSDTIWMGVGTIFLGFLLLGGVRALVRRLFLVRLAKLRHAARSITAGNLDVRAPVEGRDTIASLARDFNNMAEATSQLISEVRESESQLTNVMNSLNDGLVVLDRNLRIIGVNRSFSRRLGKHPEELRNVSCRHAAEGMLSCYVSGLESAAQQCLATGEVQRAIFREEREDGPVEEVYASPILDENGDVTQVVEIWRDITERVNEEERLAEVERMVSLGVLASGFSHEVSTPLASILASAESVLGRIDESGSQPPAGAATKAIRESAETIRQEVLRCRKITERFRRFSRGIPPSVEPIDLRKVVAGVVTLVAPTAHESGVDIRIEGEEQVPTVMANTEVVQHVLLNLLINAIQSIDRGGGSVVVRLHVDSSARIHIIDTGRGIVPEDRKHLFEPFRSRKRHGTGLGLFLSRTFMRRFGGEVRLVESTVGKGSCFEIEYPLAVTKDEGES